MPSPNSDQHLRFSTGAGFIAALDQSGGSTPTALEQHGIPPEDFHIGEDLDEPKMYALVHQMRTRIMSSPAFDQGRILGAILFKHTMDNPIVIDGEEVAPGAAQFLWQKGIVPFLKIDEGLAGANTDVVQMMKPMPNLGALLARAVENGVYGTKMRSVIHRANPEAVKLIVQQQFEFARIIIDAGLVPIVEPEVNIKSPDKEDVEDLLKSELLWHIDWLRSQPDRDDQQVILKLTLPEKANFYRDLVEHDGILKVVALSGGYSRDEANKRLCQNDGVVASFSRALVEGLHHDQSPADFDAALDNNIKAIFDASMDKQTTGG